MKKTTLPVNNYALTSLFLLISILGIAQTQTFTTVGSNSFTVPAGVTSLTIQAWGGGGRGGSAIEATVVHAGGGGGGGAYSKKVMTVIPGNTYNLVVGGGGDSDTNLKGGDSTFNVNSVTAKGGTGVVTNALPGGNGGIWAPGDGNSGYSGGNGASGIDSSYGGGAGSSAGTASIGSNGNTSIGATAPSGGGNGGNGATTNGNSGLSGTVPGGGGGGATKGGGSGTPAGGNGADGKIIIAWSCPSYNLNTTTVATPICNGNTATVSVTSTAASLPTGSYIVTYDLNAPNAATGNTATMTVTTAGSGNFTTNSLANSGITTITIKNLASGGTSPNNCTATIGSNNTASITVNATPTITATAPNSRNNAGTVALGATASAGTISWFAAATGGTSLATWNSYTPTISTTTTYYVQSTNSSCTTPIRTAVTATIYNPEIDITGNNISIPDGDITPSVADYTDFGSTRFPNAPIVKTFTLFNNGTGNLNLTGDPTISITGSTDFTVATFPGTSIAGSSSTTFQIRFNPSTAGLKTATISIANDDINEDPYDFTIQGTGIQASFDSDGDGIYDNVDIDDDNDGIKDITEQTNCKAVNGYNVSYKFLNESFGTGARAPLNSSSSYVATTNYCYEDGTGGTNTTDCPKLSSKILDDGEYCIVSVITKPGDTNAPENIHGDLAWYDGEDHTSGDSNGRMAVFNAALARGVFYQTTITGILPNTPITYSFWVLNILSKNTNNDPNMIDPNITVEFLDLSGTVLTSINTGDVGRCSSNVLDNTCAQGVWQQFTTSVNLGNVNTFTIRFINNAPGGGGNDLALDDILITQTLCDKDGDGVPDLFDLDCDNDGIEDVIEAGLGNLSNGKGKIDVAWVDANGDGLHDSATSTANQASLDSDGDGVPNYLDLDSDNDSLFDVDESGVSNTNAASGYANGDGDINGDGTGDGPETEKFRSKDFDGNGTIGGFGDGILDIYDYGIVAGATTSITPANFKIAYGNSGQGISTSNPATTYLKDTNNDGKPDYLDIISNGTTFDIANNKLIYAPKVIDDGNGKVLGTTDIDKDGILDSFDTNTAYFGSPRDLRTKLFLDFDGRNDYGQSTPILGGLANASLMGWINLNSAFSTDGVIVGQNNFQIRISSAKKLEAVVNGTPYPYNTALNVSQWYNVAATYDGTNLKLYLNGALVLNKAKSGAISADTSLLTIGRDPGTNGPTGTKYFKGKIDEVRIFNVALTDSQLQRMVYQEIDETSAQLRGKIIPKDIAKSTETAIPFTNLLRYYRMDTYKDDIVDDLTTLSIDSGTGMKIYNHKNIYVQQAPMPFLTERSGDFATAVNSTTKEIRGDDIMDQDWSIVKVQHNITAIADNIDLGMIVDPGQNIVMNSDTNIQNDWYLKLDGKIDLQGMSQLLQTTESDLDATSAGSIERDQQGQSNKYNYNYWSSPVSPINSPNNSNYSVTGIMKDGYNAIPRNIDWVSGYDGTPGSAGTPVKLARYWLYKFESNNDAYANWIQITENSTLRAGQGYTLKGSGAASKFTFVGKPNNGTISNTVGPGQLLLIGNPYPSAINADKFLDDNLTTVERSAIDGTLYFWQHAPENNTHILANYLGSYGVLNKSGGIAAVTPSAINGQGTAAKIPKRDIPVGQGFFVYGTTAGGVVQFKNSQRIFAKETDATSNTLFKTMPVKDKIRNNNNNDSLQNDTFKRIRLGFDSNNNYHRQVLLAFMEEKATSGIDDGYDGYMFDDFPNDMCLLNGEEQLVIEGEGFFDASSSYPIGVKTDTEGKVKFMLDGLENFDTGQAIYIHDSITDIYHDIRNEAFEINLPEGENNTRFSLRFTNRTLGVAEKTITNINTITTAYLKNENTIIINNNVLDVMVKKVSLFNSIGQSIISWKIENQEQQNIKLPVKKISSGVYIAKIQTTKGDLSKKIIIP
jgi:hypothetical protein